MLYNIEQFIFFILFLIPLFICQIMRVGILYDINRKIMKTKKKEKKNEKHILNVQNICSYS